MKRVKLNQNGFEFVMVLVLLVVIGVIAFAGYTVTHKSTAVDTAANLNTTHKVPATIKNSADINTATAALDETPIDSSVNPDGLDKDLNALL